jgi:hypothetical protein
METTENESREQAGEGTEAHKWALFALWHGWNQMAHLAETLEERVAFRAMREETGKVLKAQGCPCLITNADEFIPIRMACVNAEVNFLPSDYEAMRAALAKYDADCVSRRKKEVQEVTFGKLLKDLIEADELIEAAKLAEHKARSSGSARSAAADRRAAERLLENARRAAKAALVGAR